MSVFRDYMKKQYELITILIYVNSERDYCYYYHQISCISLKNNSISFFSFSFSVRCFNNSALWKTRKNKQDYFMPKLNVYSFKHINTGKKRHHRNHSIYMRAGILLGYSNWMTNVQSWRNLNSLGKTWYDRIPWREWHLLK